MTGSSPSTALSANLVQRVRDLFTELRWDVSEDGDADIFKRFCEMLALLRDEERALILDISRDFYNCSLANYARGTSKLVALLNNHLGTSPRQIIAVPLVKPEDVGKVKSANLALYLLRTDFEPIARAKKWKFVAWDRPELLPEKHANRKDAVILLVDDFLGSGETAVSALEAYHSNWAVPTDEVIVLALVAQQRAVDAVIDQGASCLVPSIRQRGISDSTRVKDIPAALAVMDGLEERLNVRPDDRRGYHSSEALVSMRRCPNNTFPVYWTTKAVDGQPWPAPFTR